MTPTEILFPVTCALPLLLAAGCFWPTARVLISRCLWIAPLPGLLLAQGLSRQDPAGSLLLAAAALLWMVAGGSVPGFFQQKKPDAPFLICWLLTLTGSLSVFVVRDFVGFLIAYALVSLPAFGLVIWERTPEARRAGGIYLGFALLGENLLLPAFVLLAAGVSGASPVVLALVILGFGMKMALLPMHFWMPLTYTAAPVPAAAVLSGAAVKAGVIGLLRFLPFDSGLTGWGETLTVVGFGGAFFGVAVGLTQRNPKTILAYSSVSQMGFLAAVLGMGLSAGDHAVLPLAAFYAAHHVLAKGALFLGVGAAGARRIVVLIPAALLGLGLAGLPLTGGALAKLAVKAPVGYGFTATLASLSAAATALLMTHFVFRLSETSRTNSAPPRSVTAAWLTGAVLCFVFPWLTFSRAGLVLGEMVTPAALWKTFWPVALGVLAAFALRRIRLPEIPPGDIAACGPRVARTAGALATVLARKEASLRSWPVACMLLLATVLAVLTAFAAIYK